VGRLKYSSIALPIMRLRFCAEGFRLYPTYFPHN
jgi:hypothetical protein